MKTKDLLKQLIGKKVISITDTTITLEGGEVCLIGGNVISTLKAQEKLKQKPTTPVETGSVIDYLRSLGFNNFYSDKRKDHYRLKVAERFTEKQLKLVKRLSNSEIKISVEKLQLQGWQMSSEERLKVSSTKNNRGWYEVDRIVLRTNNKPSAIKIG